MFQKKIVILTIQNGLNRGIGNFFPDPPPGVVDCQLQLGLKQPDIFDTYELSNFTNRLTGTYYFRDTSF